MSPQDCSRFEGCNAPVCPLSAWRRARHLRGESVCLYLRESVKAASWPRIATALAGEVRDLVGQLRDAIQVRSAAPAFDGAGMVRRELQRAASTGSKIEAGARFRS